MKEKRINEEKTNAVRDTAEEQMLELDELMDVQGGIEEKNVPNCGLGCYTGGFTDPTKNKDEEPGH